MSKKILRQLARSDVDMDNINSWLLALHEAIDAETVLTVEEQEELEAIIYGNISHYLEKFFDFPGYGNYN